MPEISPFKIKIINKFALKSISNKIFGFHKTLMTIIGAISFKWWFPLTEVKEYYEISLLLSTSSDTICVDREYKLASMIVEKSNADLGMSVW